MKLYVLMSDVVGSSSLSDREDLTSRIQQAAKRINEDHRSELFADFDAMAQSLQRRAEPRTPTPSASAGAAPPQTPEAMAPTASRLPLTAAEPAPGDGAPTSGS